MNAVELLGALAKSHKELLEEVKARNDCLTTQQRIEEGERVQKALVEYNSRMHLLDLRDL